MPLTFPEVISDLPAMAALVPVVEAAIEKLNASEKKPSSYCIFASEILGAVGPLVDIVNEQVKS